MSGRTEHLPWQEIHGEREVNYCCCCSGAVLFSAVCFCVQRKRKRGKMLLSSFVPLYLNILLLGLLTVLGVGLHIE